MDVDQQFRAVKSPADLRKLPGFVETVNPAVVGLKRVIWKYDFKSELQCGLTNCRRFHKEGVIVELEDGSVSNIGHICGADADKYGPMFALELRKFDDEQLLKTMMPVLLDRSKLEQIEREVRSAYREGQLWLRRRLSFESLFPEAMRDVIRRNAGGASMVVTEAFERSAAQIDEMVSSGTAPNRTAARYYEVSKGTIEGSGMLALSECELEKMWRNADNLLAANPQAAKMPELISLFTDVNRLPLKAREVVDACESARKFFSSSNFATISFLPMKRDARERLINLTLDALDAHALPTKAKSIAKPLNKKQRDHYRRAGLPIPDSIE